MDRILQYFPELTQTQIEQFRMLKPLYEDWNSKINVISRKDMDSFYLHHVLHSLALAKVMKVKESEKIIDIGTGGGFPGIPLAVIFPHGDFTLCDSIGKKTKVAAAVAESLGLKNVKVVNKRAEEISEQFDHIISRAVTSLDNFIPWTKKMKARSIYLLKGGDIDAELDTCFVKGIINPKTLTLMDISLWFKEEWFEEKKIVTVNNL